MGASFSYRVYRATSIDEVKKKWSSDVEQSLYESGHSYSGEIGMLGEDFIVTQTCKTIEESIEYIEDNHKKWETALCVPTTDKSGYSAYVVGGWCSS